MKNLYCSILLIIIFSLYSCRNDKNQLYVGEPLRSVDQNELTLAKLVLENISSLKMLELGMRKNITITATGVIDQGENRQALECHITEKKRETIIEIDETTFKVFTENNSKADDNDSYQCKLIAMARNFKKILVYLIAKEMNFKPDSFMNQEKNIIFTKITPERRRGQNLHIIDFKGDSSHGTTAINFETSKFFNPIEINYYKNLNDYHEIIVATDYDVEVDESELEDVITESAYK